LFENLFMASSSAASITRETFDEHDNRLQTAAVKALKAAAGALPADIEFHRTLDSDYATALDATAARVLRLTNGLLGLAESSRTGKGKGRLRDKEDVLDRFHAVVVDAMDGMLEQTVRSALL
jgi:exosome complex exonuclease RRP6